MYQSFSIVTMESVMANKQIIVHANADINVNSIKDAIIEVYQRGSKENVTFTVEVKNKLLIIIFRDWPIPNAEYIVSISKLKSVTDEDLDSSVKKKIVFKSDIVSTVEIVNPTMHEALEELNIQLRENAEKDTDLIGSYYVEVATDNTFYDTVIKTFIQKNLVKLSLQEAGQYYLRVRPQRKDDTSEYGSWSDVITFMYNSNDLIEEDDYIEDGEEENAGAPEIDLSSFELISTIEQGVTPKSLVLEFSKDVDQLSLDNIVILRKVVK